jgi:hypothetical protein
MNKTTFIDMEKHYKDRMKEKIKEKVALIETIKEQKSQNLICKHMNVGFCFNGPYCTCDIIRENFEPSEVITRCHESSKTCEHFEKYTLSFSTNEDDIIEDYNDNYEELGIWDEKEAEQKVRETKLKLSQKTIFDLYKAFHEDKYSTNYYEKALYGEFQKYPVEHKMNQMLCAMRMSGNKYADDLEFITIKELEDRKEELLREIKSKIRYSISID